MAALLMKPVMRLIAPVMSIIVTCKIVNSTISEIPNDDSMPAADALMATPGEVLKNTTAMTTVRTHPAMPLSAGKRTSCSRRSKARSVSLTTGK